MILLDAGWVKAEVRENYSERAQAVLAELTEGDFEAAVASSHESLKLRPGEAAYLDTLGRCSYAAGDLPSAITYQSEAIRKDPHSGQMRRQLALFKQAAEKK